MGGWLRELRENGGDAGGIGGDMVVHTVGCKADIVAADPRRREVPFEKCIRYVAEQLYPETATPGVSHPSHRGSSPHLPVLSISSPQSNRSSGLWAQEQVWDCCHEISAKDGEGIDEVFRVVTRKLVEQHHDRVQRQKMLEEALMRSGRTPGGLDGVGGVGYFDMPGGGTGSFRVGHGDKRRSWLGFPTTPGALTAYTDEGDEGEDAVRVGRRRCC